MKRRALYAVWFISHDRLSLITRRRCGFFSFCCGPFPFAAVLSLFPHLLNGKRDLIARDPIP